MKIQKPTKGRVVLVTLAPDAGLGRQLAVPPSPEHVGTVVGVFPGGVVDVAYFRKYVYVDVRVSTGYAGWAGTDFVDVVIGLTHSLEPKPNTWRYPPRETEEIEVSE